MLVPSLTRSLGNSETKPAGEVSIQSRPLAGWGPLPTYPPRYWAPACTTHPPVLAGFEDGQHPHPRKEHIANQEQIVYICFLAKSTALVVGSPNPGHKEWEQSPLPLSVSSKVPPWISRRPWMPRSRSRARFRPGLDRAARQERQVDGRGDGLDRLARPRYRARHRSIAARPDGRDLRAESPPAGATCALDTWPRRRRRAACAFVDAEHALDPVYARKLGVKVDDLLISQQDTGDRRWKFATRWCARRDQRAGDRFGCRADAPCRVQRPDGRRPARQPGPPDEPGAAQAHRLDQPAPTPS